MNPLGGHHPAAKITANRGKATQPRFSRRRHHARCRNGPQAIACPSRSLTCAFVTSDGRARLALRRRLDRPTSRRRAIGLPRRRWPDPPRPARLECDVRDLPSAGRAAQSDSLQHWVARQSASRSTCPSRNQSGLAPDPVTGSRAAVGAAGSHPFGSRRRAGRFAPGGVDGRFSSSCWGERSSSDAEDGLRMVGHAVWVDVGRTEDERLCCRVRS